MTANEFRFQINDMELVLRGRNWWRCYDGEPPRIEDMATNRELAMLAEIERLRR